MKPVTAKYCPFCNSKIIRNKGNKICSNLSCGAYEVNDENYNISKKKWKGNNP